MLILKYEKTGAARFISHIDILRHFTRILRRADVSVGFSNGFNPHMLIYFSPPLALGVGSVAEYASIEAKDVAPDEFMKRFNEAAPDGLKASKVFSAAKDPKLQARVVCSDYVLPEKFDLPDFSNGFSMEYEKQGEKTVEEVSDKIYAVFARDGKTVLRLASGNPNLRADRFVAQLNKNFGLSVSIPQVLKTAQYVKIGEELADVDEYLENSEIAK